MLHWLLPLFYYDSMNMDMASLVNRSFYTTIILLFITLKRYDVPFCRLSGN
jgi:hypothetical protein